MHHVYQQGGNSKYWDGYFHKESASDCAGKICSIIIRSSGEVKVNLEDHLKIIGGGLCNNADGFFLQGD